MPSFTANPDSAQSPCEPGSVRYADDALLALKKQPQSVYILRNDERRAVLCEVNPEGHTVSQTKIMHPADAVTLALFDGRRTVRDVIARAAQLFQCDEDRIRRQLTPLLNSPIDVVTPVNGAPPTVYDPRSFIVPEARIDITSKRLYRPIGMLLHASDDCMRRCRYCSEHKRRTTEARPLPLPRLVELFQECGRIGMLEIILGGGDPLMRPDIAEVVAAVIRHAGIVPFISTKGHVTARLANSFAQAGLDWMQVSLDSPYAPVADMLTGSPGFLAQALDSIRNLQAAGIRVQTKSVITRHNVGHGLELAEMLHGMGVRPIRFDAVGLSMHEPESEDLLVGFEESDRLRDAVAELPREWEVTFNGTQEPVRTPAARARAFAARAACTAGQKKLFVHSDGKVMICGQMEPHPDHTVGNLSTESVMDVWNSPRIPKLRHPPQERFKGTACGECAEFDECHAGAGRCFREAMKAYGSFYAPSPTCPKAPLPRRLQ